MPWWPIYLVQDSPRTFFCLPTAFLTFYVDYSPKGVAQAFVPVLSEIKEQHGDDKVRIFVAQAAGTLGTILLLVTLLGVIGSPVIAALFGTSWFIDWWQGGGDAEKFVLASALLKLTFPYLFLFLWLRSVALCSMFTTALQPQRLLLCC